MGGAGGEGEAATAGDSACVAGGKAGGREPRPSPEELIARGIAPIKPEFVVDARPKVAVEAVKAEGAFAEKKSRRKIKEMKREERQAALCWAFAKGECHYGEGCKKSHDVAAYLATKEPELPGRCPFDSSEECSYGLMCRWLSKHKSHSEFTKEQIAKAAEVHADEAEEAEGEEDGGEEAAKEGGGDGSVPAGILELPVPDKIEKEANTLPYDLMGKLRKKADIFPRSTEKLQELGYTKSAWRKRAKGGQRAKKQMKVEEDSDISSAKETKIYDVRREAEADGTSFDKEVPLKADEKRKVDFRGKLYLAPLTTVGNLAFRRVCKVLGADITCCEMAMATNLLQGNRSEWALLKRHPSEDLFGIQICGGYPDAVSKTAEMLEDNVSMDFLDVNCGCPIDLVCNKGAGSSLLCHVDRLEAIVRAGSAMVSCPFTFKTRKAFYDNCDVTHTFVDKAAGWGAAAMTLHGRTRAQRYSKRADWEYVTRCARIAAPTGLQLIGNGDIFSYDDYRQHMEASRGEDGEGEPGLATCMIARGALIKPWIFTEIKEQRAWDISASERLEILKQFCSTGLEHWGSDTKGVETTRRFLLEALSFLHRYIPIGLLDVLPPQLHWRPPAFVGRNDLETLFASGSCSDWVRISEMLLGPAPPGFHFAPKHKSNAYAPASTSEAAMALEEGVENG